MHSDTSYSVLFYFSFLFNSLKNKQTTKLLPLTKQNAFHHSLWTVTRGLKTAALASVVLQFTPLWLGYLGDFQKLFFSLSSLPGLLLLSFSFCYHRTHCTKLIMYLVVCFYWIISKNGIIRSKILARMVLNVCTLIKNNVFLQRVDHTMSGHSDSWSGDRWVIHHRGLYLQISIDHLLSTREGRIVGKGSEFKALGMSLHVAFDRRLSSVILSASSLSGLWWGVNKILYHCRCYCWLLLPLFLRLRCAPLS